MRKGKKVTSEKKNWIIIVESFIGMKLSDLYDTKNGIIESTCEQYKKWKQNGHPVKFVRSNNTGKITKPEKAANRKS